MPTECDKKSTVDYFENGTHRENIFEFNDTNSCEAPDPVNGTWKNLGNSVYDISDINIPGITVTSNQKITFDGNKLIMEFSGTLNIEGVQTQILCKVTLVDKDTFAPDGIIGTWRFDQEFINNVENGEMTVCEKTMTIRFFEKGIYEKKDFEEIELLCVAFEIKNGSWSNSGSDMYEISDLGVPEFKITFANNKMTVEFTDTEKELRRISN